MARGAHWRVAFLADVFTRYTGLDLAKAAVELGHGQEGLHLVLRVGMHHDEGLQLGGPSDARGSGGGVVLVKVIVAWHEGVLLVLVRHEKGRQHIGVEHDR